MNDTIGVDISKDALDTYWCKTRSNNGPQKRLHSAVVAE